MIVTSNFAKALWPGVNKFWGMEYNEFPVEWDKIFSKESSRKAWEEDVSTAGLGLAQVVGEGGSVVYQDMQQGWVDRYTHLTYKLGFTISEEMVEDDLHDVVSKRKSGALAFSMRQTKEIVAANILNRAFNTSYTYGDGVELCASNHPYIKGGTWANELAVASDLSEAALEQAVIDIGKYQDEAGLKIAVRPQTLIVPVDVMFDADKIMMTEYEVGTDNNTKNVVRSKFPGGVVVNHYLTDTDAWFIKTDAKDGLKLFQRREDRFGMDGDFDTDNAKFKGSMRFSVGCTDKRGIFGSEGA